MRSDLNWLLKCRPHAIYVRIPSFWSQLPRLETADLTYPQRKGTFRILVPGFTVTTSHQILNVSHGPLTVCSYWTTPTSKEHCSKASFLQSFSEMWCTLFKIHIKAPIINKVNILHGNFKKTFLFAVQPDEIIYSR